MEQVHIALSPDAQQILQKWKQKSKSLSFAMTSQQTYQEVLLSPHSRRCSYTLNALNPRDSHHIVIAHRYSSFLVSTPHACTAFCTSSWTPGLSLPNKRGWNNPSVERKRAELKDTNLFNSSDDTTCCNQRLVAVLWFVWQAVVRYINSGRVSLRVSFNSWQSCVIVQSHKCCLNRISNKHLTGYQGKQSPSPSHIV